MKNFDLSLLLIRLGLGIMLLMHGIAKIINGVGGVKGMLASKGLPEFIAYFAYLGEVIAPIMLIIGLYTRMACVFVLGTCFTIVFVAYYPSLFALTNHGGFRAEIVYLYIFMALAIIFSGSGKYAARRD
ncbi:hypothetical protein LMG7974_00208 [Campylobacter majalis]|uniref:DoxX family protein n=1 Tax=Campylobacter majalis TaxID=2790656 RepID=A0ABM8Q2N5_9BACT|nr:DoxX family protein [Campylobacter majalis]CAD7287033.1 hypothetical protein LMG7974_00208 [Campylobacter majalis]